MVRDRIGALRGLADYLEEYNNKKIRETDNDDKDTRPASKVRDM